MMRARWIFLILCLLAIPACQKREAEGDGGATTTRPPPPRSGNSGTGVTSLPVVSKPNVDREPDLAVLLTEGATVTVTTRVTCSVGSERFAAGQLSASSRNGRIFLAGRDVGAGPVDLTMPSSTGSDERFSVEVSEPGANGKRETLRCAGRLRLALNGSRVQVIELIALESYLPGVLTVEMHAGYPAAALQAQAIAARSYAASRWRERAHLPWQVSWHHSIDMRYAALNAPKRAVGEAAVRATRGLLLRCDNQPILAYFHAASGGRTESATAINADADGARVMHPVDDAPSIEGARQQNLSASHFQWKTTLTYAALSDALQTWSRGDNRRPQFGTVRSIAIENRQADSGRVAQVRISHVRAGRTLSDLMPATDFRLAVGAGTLRSTWWTTITAVRDGVVIAGKGYGHGIGLSQVGAWMLARTGRSARDIVAHYYPDAQLVRAY